MVNVDAKLDGNGKLVIVVDLDQEHGPSTSGKTIIIASTQGNQKVPGHENMSFGLNVYRKK
jgi:hypothetical protein